MVHMEMIVDQQYPGLNPVQFGYEVNDPSHGFGPTVREYWLLHYVVSGFGVYELNGKTYHIGPGEIFFIPPFVRTYYKADDKKPWYYIWIGFTTDYELPSQFEQPVINFPEAGDLFEEMKNCQYMENGKNAFLSGCLWKLMGMFLDQTKPKYDFIDKAISFIHAEYSNPITIQEIAKHLNLDRRYFSGAFSKRVGSSPQQYLVNLRLTKAAELMIKHGEKPSTAAASVGYTDLYQFSKMFKQHFGMSPREYVKHHVEKEK